MDAIKNRINPGKPWFCMIAKTNDECNIIIMSIGVTFYSMIVLKTPTTLDLTVLGNRCIWFTCMELYGVVWSCMELYGVVWSCMELYGVVWSCMELYGVVWSCMELYGVVWSCMELYGVRSETRTQIVLIFTGDSSYGFIESINQGELFITVHSFFIYTIRLEVLEIKS